MSPASGGIIYIETVHILHESYAMVLNLNSIIRTARTSRAASSWIGIAARLTHFFSGAYHLHSPLNFQVAFVFFGCLKVPGKLVGFTALKTPSTFVLLPNVIVVVFLCPHCHLASGKCAKIWMALTTAQPPSAPLISNSLMFCLLSAQTEGHRRFSKRSLSREWYRGASTTNESAAVGLDGCTFRQAALSGSLVLMSP